MYHGARLSCRLSSPIRFFSPSYFGVRKPLHLGELSTFPLVTHSQHWLSKLSTASWRKIFRIGSLSGTTSKSRSATINRQRPQTFTYIGAHPMAGERKSAPDAQAELQGIRKDQTAHQTALLIHMLICYLHF
jgi:hypothetical protein